MLPVGDVIPSRTRPVLTSAFAVAELALVGPPQLRPWAVVWIVNALAVGIYGRALEDRMGHGRFAVLAALGVAGAAIAAALVAPGPAALLCASGLAAAVGGAYVARFPGSRVLAIVPVPFGIELMEIPAWFVAAVWGVVHLATALGALTHAATVALLTAWVASGLLGAVAVRLLVRPERMSVNWWG
jgi:membrane associated rhomboid family serine protease